MPVTLAWGATDWPEGRGRRKPVSVWECGIPQQRGSLASARVPSTAVRPVVLQTPHMADGRMQREHKLSQPDLAWTVETWNGNSGQQFNPTPAEVTAGLLPWWEEGQQALGNSGLTPCR